MNPSYLKSFLQLTSAEFIGAAIVIGFAPIISRMYSAADFGHYELYYSFATIATAVSMMGYERSILLVNSEQEQFDALLVAAACLSITFLFTFFCVTLVGQLADNQHIALVWTWALPLFVLSAGLNNLLYTYLTRLGQFSVLASLKVVSSLVAMVTQVAFAMGNLGFVGLVLSNLFTQFLVAIYLLIVSKSQISSRPISMNRRRIFDLAMKHWRLPILFLPGNVLSIFTKSIPTIFFARIDMDLLGYLAFTRRIMGLPLGALGSSMQRIYENALSNEITKTGKPLKVVLKSLRIFSCVGLLLFVGLVVVGRPAIPLLFGNQWLPAIPFVILFGFDFCNKFVFGSISSIMFFGKLPKFDIFWHLLNLLVVTMCFVAASHYQLSILWTAVAYVITSSLTYQLYGIAMVYFSTRADLLKS